MQHVEDERLVRILKTMLQYYLCTAEEYNSTCNFNGIAESQRTQETNATAAKRERARRWRLKRKLSRSEEQGYPVCILKEKTRLKEIEFCLCLWYAEAR